MTKTFHYNRVKTFVSFIVLNPLYDPFRMFINFKIQIYWLSQQRVDGKYSWVSVRKFPGGGGVLLFIIIDIKERDDKVIREEDRIMEILKENFLEGEYIII